jgi:hypothetical protein
MLETIYLSIVAALFALGACSADQGSSPRHGAESCIEIDRVHTPPVRQGDSGRVRVIQRRVPCPAGEENPEEPPFRNEIAASRHLAREGFPVEVTLHVNPFFDENETDVARFIIPSEWFDPNVPPLMVEIADGELRGWNIYTLAALVDGQYRNRRQVTHDEVETYHQIALSGADLEDTVAPQIEGLSSHLSEYYTFVRSDENGLLLFHRDSPFATKDQFWTSAADAQDSIWIVCFARDLDGRGPPQEPLEYSLCSMSFMAAPYIRVNTHLLHSQIDDWRFHREQALSLVESWRAE